MPFSLPFCPSPCPPCKPSIGLPICWGSCANKEVVIGSGFICLDILMRSHEKLFFVDNQSESQAVMHCTVVRTKNDFPSFCRYLVQSKMEFLLAREFDATGTCRRVMGITDAAAEEFTYFCRCDVCRCSLFRGDNWYHKPGTNYDLCARDFGKLPEEERQASKSKP